MKTLIPAIAGIVAALLTLTGSVALTYEAYVTSVSPALSIAAVCFATILTIVATLFAGITAFCVADEAIGGNY